MGEMDVHQAIITRAVELLPEFNCNWPLDIQTWWYGRYFDLLAQMQEISRAGPHTVSLGYQMAEPTGAREKTKFPNPSTPVVQLGSDGLSV